MSAGAFHLNKENRRSGSIWGGRRRNPAGHGRWTCLWAPVYHIQLAGDMTLKAEMSAGSY